MLIRGALTLFVVLFLVATSAMLVQAQSCYTEGESKACGSNIGICEEGVQSCRAGEWTDCDGDTEPELEVCDNGQDDDCDGLVDECIGSMWPVMIVVGILLLFFMAMLMKMGF
jgi:hypothetical protein